MSMNPAAYVVKVGKKVQKVKSVIYNASNNTLSFTLKSVVQSGIRRHRSRSCRAVPRTPTRRCSTTAPR